ncbi:MAG: tetratricopeptide repeat protein [Pseudomonadota bacterium]
MLRKTTRYAVVGAIAVAGALATAAAPGPGAKAAETLSGAYLAARHAAQISDIAGAARHFATALRRDPDNRVLMEQAIIYQTAAGDLENALKIARKLEAETPGHRMSALILTADAIKSGDFASASARIEGAPGAYHPLIGAMLGAWSAHGAGEHEKAEAALAKLDNRAIYQIFSGYHQGLMRHARGDAAAAVTAFELAAGQMTTPTGRIARAYAAALRDTGDAEGARALYDGASSIAVGDALLEAEIAAMEAGEAPSLLVATPAEGAAEALYGLAAALGRDGEERLSLFYTRTALYLRPSFDEAALLAAELLHDQSQYDLAIAAYEKIAAESPLARSAEIGRADALRARGDEAEAIEALKAVLRRDPDAVDAHIALGDLYRRTERFAEGIEPYGEAIRLMEAQGRPNWVLYYQRGICHERAKLWEQAEDDFQRALELEADQPLVLNYLGYSWLEMDRNLDQAMDMIRKAVEQRPEDGYIVDSLGWGYFLLEDYDNAVLQLERAIELRPIDPVINDHLGDALWMVGRRLEAEFQWKRALSFDPEDDDRTRIVDKLKRGLDAVVADENARSGNTGTASTGEENMGDDDGAGAAATANDG